MDTSKIKKGLGRGLSSLIGETKSEINVNRLSISDLVNIIAKIMDIKPEITLERKRFRPKKSEVDRLICDNSKARKILKWKPNSPWRI